MSLPKLLTLAVCLAVSGAASAQIDLARGGPISTMTANPKPLAYVSQALARNALPTYTYRYFDDVYAASTGVPSNVQLVADPAGSGRPVFKMMLNKTDPLSAGASRTEISAKYDYTISGVRWYAISLYFPGDWITDPNPSVVAQIHTSQKTVLVPPPLSVVVSGTDINLELHRNHRSPNATVDPMTKANSGSQVVRLAKLETKRWYCMVVRADWSNVPGTGSLTFWMNGTVAYQTKAAYNSYETWLGNYPKVGVYQPGVMYVSQRSLYTDFIHLGGANSNYLDMAKLTPCGTTPTPVMAATAK